MAQQQGAFRRANAMMVAISEILATGAIGLKLQSEIAKLGEYESRGHGGRYKANRSRPIFGLSGWSHNKKPHKGKRECARRVRQASGEKLPSVPRRMWSLDHDIGGVPKLSDISKQFRQFATLN